MIRPRTLHGVMASMLIAGCGMLPNVAWGPLAVTATNHGMDARNVGVLVLTDRCAFLDRADERILLGWPADRTAWSVGAREVEFRRSGGKVVTLGDGDPIVVGGGVRAEWPNPVDWVVPPDPVCGYLDRWLVSDVIPP